MAGDEKPRIFQDGRDMLINVVVIVAAMLLVVGATGLCTFNPGAPENGPVNEVDAQTFLGMEARAMDFPVRDPKLPEGWVPNSARRTMLADAPAPVVGWVTPEGGYVQLTQTAAPLDQAVREIDEHPRELARTVRVGETEAQVFTGDDARDVWAVDNGDARLLITGAATDEEFSQLVSSSVEASPIASSTRF